MKKEDLFEAIGEAADEEMLEQCEQQMQMEHSLEMEHSLDKNDETNIKKKRFSVINWLAAAACLALSIFAAYQVQETQPGSGDSADLAYQSSESDKAEEAETAEKVETAEPEETLPDEEAKTADRQNAASVASGEETEDKASYEAASEDTVEESASTDSAGQIEDTSARKSFSGKKEMFEELERDYFGVFGNDF
jgi:hypothetical protein